MSPVADLHLLDAESLELLGEARVGPYARRVAAEGGHVLYSAAEGYLLMDVHDASAPLAQAYFSLLGSRRAALIEDSVIIQDGGGLKSFDATFANLPGAH